MIINLTRLPPFQHPIGIINLLNQILFLEVLWALIKIKSTKILSKNIKIKKVKIC
jgi:hypothetical protein